MKIVLDVFGGDYAPEEIIKGAVAALNENKNLTLVLTGDEEIINNELKKYNFDSKQIEILHAPDVITNDDIPTLAIKQKKDSSLVIALEYLKNNEDAIGMVSAGSTGAVLTGSILKIGRIKGISRPGLAPILPTVPGGQVMLIDCGANMDSKPIYLAHFALMGAAYMRSVAKIENPKVALLSVGVEDKKGNELTHEAFKLLKQLPVNFVGNMEARDILSGDYDVVVSDGFMGNIALKSLEGMAVNIFTLLKQSIKSSLRNKIGAAVMKPALKELSAKMDYKNNGGAVFLGVDKIIVKSHGSSKSKSITASINQVAAMYREKLIENIKLDLNSVDLNIE